MLSKINKLKVLGVSLDIETKLVLKDIAKNVTSITIPDGITSVGRKYNISYMDKDTVCNVNKIYLPEGLRDIDSYAFAYMPELEVINIPESVEYIKDMAFYYTKKLKKLKIPNGLKSIGKEAFAQSGIEEVTLPRYLRMLDNEAFRFSGLRRIDFNHCNAFLNDGVFNGCKIEEILNISETVEVIEYDTFGDLSELRYIDIPNSLNTVGEGAFFSAKVEELDFSRSGLRSIRSFAFDSCKELREIKFPKCLDYIGHGIFDKCYNLEKIDMGDCDIDDFNLNEIQECSKLNKLRLPFKVKDSIENQLNGFMATNTSFLKGVEIEFGN